jgi:16S rRNA (cytosine1402-N4)-methyltransferase
VTEAEEPGHLPVLLEEVAFILRPRVGGWVVDGTVGMGGHAERLLERAPPATRLLGIDTDPEALQRSALRLARFGPRVILRHGNFRDLPAIAAEAGVAEAATILLDLGLSSYQLHISGRGFSFGGAEPLDMRFDPTQGSTAADLLNGLEQAELARILLEYGDEPHAHRIARRIVERRRQRPLRTAGDLVAAVQGAVPRRAWPRRLNVATRTFQALRMAVNEELDALSAALPGAAGLLRPGGRLGVIAFHSGEDRIVKRAFRQLAARGYVELEPSPRGPAQDEIRHNPRARSARLRVLEREEAA